MTGYTKAIELHDGTRIPQLGFGTWRVTTPEPVASALEVGYRHIDTATYYQNEAMIGQVLAASPVTRSDIYITTKYHPTDTREPGVVIQESLTALGVEQVDLWLLHNTYGDERNVRVWEQMIAAQESGYARSIGVSNLNLAEIDELIAATGVTPVLNQFRLGPSQHDQEFIAELRQRGIAVEGYSPLRATDLADPYLNRIAQSVGADPAAVVLAWHIAKGYIVLPKSDQPQRIAANAAATEIELDSEAVALLDAMEQREYR